MNEQKIRGWLQEEFPDEELNNWVCKGVTDAIARGSEQYGITPTVLVLETRKDSDEPYPLHFFLIAEKGFNDFNYRMKRVLEIGKACAVERLQPIAVFLICEAWHRTFTEQEHQQRNGRLIEDYDDKQECVIVFGLTMDLRAAHARIEIGRDTEGKIQLGAIATLPADSALKASVHCQLLERFWRGLYSEMRRPKPQGFGKRF